MLQRPGVIRTLLAMQAAAFLMGCASQPIPVAMPEATIINKTGKALASVQYQACGGATGWSALPGSALSPGGSMRVTLPAACTDLNAFYADGKLAGQQRGVKREFPFEWALY
jgi:hypothetical protein